MGLKVKLLNMSSTLVTVNEYEARAYEILPQNARDYYKSGAGDEHTLSLNKEAFKRYIVLLKKV